MQQRSFGALLPVSTLTLGGGGLGMLWGKTAGRYGKAALEALGLREAVAGRVAIVDNPQVAVVMVARGDAPAALVFATDVKGCR